MGAMSRSRWPRSPSHGICSPTFCGSSRNFDRQSHQPRKAFVHYASEPNSRERCASMTENSVIFNARHAAGSFHPHRQPAPTAQDCLKRGNGANWRTTRQLSGECRLYAKNLISRNLLGPEPADTLAINFLIRRIDILEDESIHMTISNN